MRRLSLVILIGLWLLLSYSLVSLAYEKEIKSLSASMAENIQNSGKKTIAVVDFTDLQGNVTELGRFLAEEISVALAASRNGIEVIDRTHLKVILQEHKLSSTGLIDPGTARKLGKIVGVEALVTGTMTPFGDSVRMSVKIMDTNTAKIISAFTANIAKTKAIEELLIRGIESGQPANQRSPSSTGTSYASIHKGYGVVEDSYLRIVVLDFRKSGNKYANIQLEYQNKTDKEIKINYAGPHAFLSDNLGNESVGWGTIPGFILPPNGNKRVGLRFKFSPYEVKKLGGQLGNEFNLTVKHTSSPPGHISVTILKTK